MFEKNLFHTRLNELLNGRKPKKIKKIELAEQLYVTPQTVSRWCNGVIVPDRGTIELITKKINEMYGFSENSPERFRSEYLAGESPMPNYDVPLEAIEFLKEFAYINNIKNEIYTNINNITTLLGHDLEKITDIEHFQSYIYSYLEIGIISYMDNINPIIRKDEEQ